MLLALLSVAALAWQAPADTSAARPYLDPGARDLLTIARERQGSRAAAIRAYHALVTERMFVGVRALRRDRVLYRKELAARLVWHRGAPDTVAVVGAREVVPLVTRDVSVPSDSDLRHDSPELVFDPASPRLQLGGGDSSFVHDPLAPGGEGNYQYRSGDTTEIGSPAPDGRTTRLIELRVVPRRDEFHLMAGSLWVDAATGDVVAKLFRPARPYDFQRDASAKDRAESHVPWFLEPIRGDVQFITIEYALVDGRWWLPWMVAFDGVATIGSLATVPLRYERLYSDYEVEGDTTVGPGAVRRDSDSVVVRMANDSVGLLTNGALPPPFAGSVPAASETEFREAVARFAAQRVAAGPRAGFRAGTHRWLARYNRVEGLSGGAELQFDVAGLAAAASGRMGISDLSPNGELRVGAGAGGTRLQLAAFRRLAVANPSTNALGIVNSLDALLLGRDDGAYYRAWGGELAVAPALTAPQRYDLRVYWEHQSAAVTTTQASLARWLEPSHRFASDITAPTADELGTTVTLRGLDSELLGDVAFGTFDFARARLTTGVTAALPAGLIGGVEVAAGTSTGSVPAQSLWYLGGPATLRGYDGLAAAGETFWRTRVELANVLPLARVVVFSDAGWAGPRAARFRGRALASVGTGVSLLDGLLRWDVARALRSPVGWRFDVYVNGVL